MSSDYVLSLILRFSVFGTFFGHGCLAIRFVPAWLSYLRVVGVGEKSARYVLTKFHSLSLLYIIF